MEGVHRFRPTWSEVDLACIAANTSQLVALGRRKGVGIIAVVKADGYGHGAPAVARTALARGARMLAVALPEEGVALREAGIDAPVLVMGAYVPGTVEAYVRYALVATVGDFDQLRALVTEAGGRRVEVHLKVDTGMGRLGVLPEEAVELATAAFGATSLAVTGIYSHLATADDPDPAFALEQMRRFEKVVDELERKELLPPMRHIHNTAGLLRFDAGRANLARVGIGLYGLFPAPFLRDLLPLRPALSWKTRVVTVKGVPAGTGISYGQVYRTARPTTLATIPVGYADGLSRGLSGRVQVLIGGRRHPVVGRICMDQAVVDVGDAPVRVGDEVVLIGRQGDERIEAEEWAEMLETIGYEILCGVSARVPRVYLSD